MPEMLIESLHSDLHQLRCAPESVLVTLRERDGERRFGIFIARAEGESLVRALRGLRMPRPTTHDLLCSVLEHAAASVDRVIITELRNGVFHAAIPMCTGGQAKSIDSRASDALAVAVALGLPVLCEECVFESLDDTDGPDLRGTECLWPE